MHLSRSTGRLAAVILSLLALLQQVFAISWGDDMPSGITIASTKHNPKTRNTRTHLGIYVGGPIYKEERRAGTLAELMSSKFTEVIVWSVHVDPDGTLDLNKEFPIVKDGAYIGAQQHPSFANDLRQLRDSGRRVTLGFGAAGSPAFNNIRDLINKDGTATNSILWRNLTALRKALPAIESIDLNDEVTYDESSITRFAVMLRDIGFGVSLCPYRNAQFWQNVARAVNSQRPGAIQAINLQCYGGGRWNTPTQWSFPGIPVYPGIWAKGTDSGGRAVGEETPTSAIQRYAEWSKSSTLPGGFVWLYDEIPGKTGPFAEAIVQGLQGDLGGGQRKTSGERAGLFGRRGKFLP